MNSINIYWFLAIFADKKVSIAPRIEMLTELKRLGYNVLLLTYYKKDPKRFNINVKYLKCLPFGNLSRISFNFSSTLYIIRKIVNDKRFIIVVDQHGIYGVLIAKAILKYLIKRDIYVHFDVRTIPVEIKGLKGKLNYIFFWQIPIALAKKFSNGFSFITNEVKNVVNIKKKNYCIWGSGVNIHKFKPLDLNHIRKSPFTIFYHGVVTENRGLQSTIKAASNFIKTGITCKVIVVGDGNYLTKLKALSKEYDIEPYVHFVGFVDYQYIQEYINFASICICPLPDLFWWRVSSPLKVMEYLSMGKPCILTEIAPHKELIPPNSKGVYWAGDGDEKAIFNAFISAYNERHLFKDYSHMLREIAINNTWNQRAYILSNYWVDNF